MILDNGSPTLIDLEEVRADGWFEQLGEESPDFDELCQVLGRRFVAFAFITGVRVTAVDCRPGRTTTSSNSAGTRCSPCRWRAGSNARRGIVSS